MKIPILIAIIFITSLFIIPAHSQSVLEIDLSKNVYFEGDVIVISGKVSSVEYARLTMQIIHLGQNEESIVNIAQLDIAQDGTFTHTIKAEGPQWRIEGEYVVRAIYGVDSVADAYFDFFTKDQDQSATFEVDIPGEEETFDVKYSITGGSLKDIILDKEFFELIVLIEPKFNGEVTLELSRSVIDAKKMDGTDDVFIILIDGVEVPYIETQNNSNSRTISIDFQQGDSDIEIIGTNVLKPLPTSTSLGQSKTGVLDYSSFRIIPEKPNVGSIIRVTGESFGENVKLEFFIGDNKLEAFSTSEEGFFIFTTQIPSNQTPDRVDFTILDTQGSEKTMSVRLGTQEKRISSVDIPLTVNPVTVQNTEPVKESTPKEEQEPITKSETKSTSQEIDIAPFVDPEQDPQYYVDRYNNEPEYKKWFDENFSQYSSIFEAVGLEEPREKIPEWIRNIFIWYAEGQISEDDLLGAIEFLVNEGIIKVKT